MGSQSRRLVSGSSRIAAGKRRLPGSSFSLGGTCAAMAKKILFVDDEPYVVILMKRRIEHSGYQVITAANGPDGLEKAKKEKPDLIVIDYTMPKMTGMELCKLLKSDPATKDIQIIVYTANTEKGMEDKCIGAG